MERDYKSWENIIRLFKGIQENTPKGYYNYWDLVDVDKIEYHIRLEKALEKAGM